MRHLLAPPAEWPRLAWSFACYVVWLYLWPQPYVLSPLAMWILPHVGYWGYHPLHDGQSMAEVEMICAERSGPK